MNTLKSWIETVYKDNGIWPTLITGLVIVALIAAGFYFDFHWVDLLP